MFGGHFLGASYLGQGPGGGLIVGTGTGSAPAAQASGSGHVGFPAAGFVYIVPRRRRLVGRGEAIAPAAQASGRGRVRLVATGAALAAAALGLGFAAVHDGEEEEFLLVLLPELGDEPVVFVIE